MNAEQKARELLASEYDGWNPADAAMIREGMTNNAWSMALRAIARALEQREGFVMVPVEPTPEMVNAACAIKLRRLTEFASGKDGSGIEAGIREDYAAMLAAALSAKGENEDTTHER